MRTVAIWFSTLLTIYAVAGSTHDKKSITRNNLDRIELSDGAELSIRVSLCRLDQDVDVDDVTIVLDTKHKKTQPQRTDWVAKNVTSLHYVPIPIHYYALAKIVDERLIVFFTWNSRYCTIDMRSGTVLKKGYGDDVLKQFEQWIPLRLRVCSPSMLVFSPELLNFREMSKSQSSN